jgi:uncharacterized metal-binding protein YceD (DUF177 family)
MKTSPESIVKIETYEPELSFPIDINKIKGGSFIKEIIATEEQCQKLAERFGLIKLGKFIANLNITRLSSSSLVIVEAVFSANVVQRCVITLDPISADIKGSYVCKYSNNSIEESSEPVYFDIMSEDPPEPIVDGQFDAGIILSEQLGLELDPFPRSRGGSLDNLSDFKSDTNYEGSSDNPFGILKNLK